jgi:hypothetical protein
MKFRQSLVYLLILCKEKHYHLPPFWVQSGDRENLSFERSPVFRHMARRGGTEREDICRYWTQKAGAIPITLNAVE